MKKLLIGAVLAMAFTTGFTCSKQTPPPAAPEVPPPAQEQMGAPAPADGAPAAPTEPPAAPAPTENH